MKVYKVVPSKSPVTSCEVNGRMHAYFTSSVLGRCRAIQIQDSPVPYELTPKALAFVKQEKSHVDLVNEEIELFEKQAPLSKGDKLKILMDCSDRLHKRWLMAWEVHRALPIYDVRLNAAFAKLQRLTQANSRLNAKIAKMLES